jgi:hypothetical protein
MNLQLFFELVGQMRAAQKVYFNERTRSSLIKAKRLESEVDQVLTAGLDHEAGADVAVQLTFTSKQEE